MARPTSDFPSRAPSGKLVAILGGLGRRDGMKRSIVLVVGLVMLPFVGSVPAGGRHRGFGLHDHRHDHLLGFVRHGRGRPVGRSGRPSSAATACSTATNGSWGRGRSPVRGRTPPSLPGAEPACTTSVPERSTTRSRRRPPTSTSSNRAPTRWPERGRFTTPSLNGTFQVAPSSGDCVTKSVTSAVFVAEAALVRFVPPDPQPVPPERSGRSDRRRGAGRGGR